MKEKTILLLPLWAFKVCSRASFTFTLVSVSKFTVFQRNLLPSPLANRHIPECSRMNTKVKTCAQHHFNLIMSTPLSATSVRKIFRSDKHLAEKARHARNGQEMRCPFVFSSSSCSSNASPQNAVVAVSRNGEKNWDRN